MDQMGSRIAPHPPPTPVNPPMINLKYNQNLRGKKFALLFLLVSLVLSSVFPAYIPYYVLHFIY